MGEREQGKQKGRRVGPARSFIVHFIHPTTTMYKTSCTTTAYEGGGATRENIPDSVTSQITSPCERHEAICGRLSVRRRARTCWRTPRPVVSVWDDLGSKWVANENEANLLKFHVSSFVVSDSNRGDGQMGYVHLHIALIFSLYVDFSVFVCVCAKECD